MKDNIIAKTDLGKIHGSNVSISEANKIYEILKDIVIQVFLNLNPIAGIAISVFSQRKLGELAEIEKRRINNLFDNLQEKTNLIDASKIDYDFIKTEEFARTVFITLEKVRVDYKEEKLKYYANILLNYSTVEFSKDFYKEGILECISKYSVEHIKIFEEIFNFYRNNNKHGKESDFDIKDIVVEGIEKEVIEICIYSFISDGLIIRDFYMGYSITNFGIKFYKTITDNKH